VQITSPVTGPTSATGPATPAQQALRYWAWEDCMNQAQTAGLKPAQRQAKCGQSPTPPDELVQYWQDLANWGDCMQTQSARGKTWAQSRAHCGVKPELSFYGLPDNPYGNG
jgi:hypothetical protein